MKQVFISYKHEDRDKARLICDTLERGGLSVWWDERITPRTAWDQSIDTAIAEAKSVLVLWSPAAVRSDWVRAEAHFGRDHGKLVPVIIESCELPLAFRLFQAIDLRQWNGDPKDRHWRKLSAWLFDLGALDAQQGSALENPYRDVIARTAWGEPIYDGLVVSSATPPGTLLRHSPDAPLMRTLPRGRFTMGGDESDPECLHHELPRRRVSIAHALAIGVYPVLAQEYHHLVRRARQDTAAPPRRSWFSMLPGRVKEELVTSPMTRQDIPMTGLAWPECADYCRALSAASGAVYRLPSEAEWEYACRGGGLDRFTCGETISSADAAFAHSDPDGPIPPGQYAPNGFGLHDMPGNVREWTLDRWHESYVGAPVDGSADTSGHSAMRVTRGGCWQDPPAKLRSSARGRATESVGARQIGFRVVLDLAAGGI
jgi:formylglycine-generating enzyme